MKLEKLNQPNFSGATAPEGWGRHVLLVVALTAVISGILLAAATGSVAASHPGVSVSTTDMVSESEPFPYGGQDGTVIVDTSSSTLNASNISLQLPDGSMIGYSPPLSDNKYKATLNVSNHTADLDVDVLIDGSVDRTVTVNYVNDTHTKSVNISGSNPSNGTQIMFNGSELSNDSYSVTTGEIRIISPDTLEDAVINRSNITEVGEFEVNLSDKSVMVSGKPLSNLDGANSITVPESVTKITIDGEIVYSADGPLGGGAGGGSSNQTIILVVVAAGAAVALLSNN